MALLYDVLLLLCAGGHHSYRDPFAVQRPRELGANAKLEDKSKTARRYSSKHGVMPILNHSRTSADQIRWLCSDKLQAVALLDGHSKVFRSVTRPFQLILGIRDVEANHWHQRVM